MFLLEKLIIYKYQKHILHIFFQKEHAPNSRKAQFSPRHTPVISFSLDVGSKRLWCLLKLHVFLLFYFIISPSQAFVYMITHYRTVIISLMIFFNYYNIFKGISVSLAISRAKSVSFFPFSK